MILHRLPSLIQWYYNTKILLRLPTHEKKLFLTFDDAPSEHCTPIILEILKKYDAKATFFCIGKNAEKFPSMFSSILEAGHCIGNHTYSHINGWKTDDDDYVSDVDRCQQIVHSRFFRPPYGRINKFQVQQLASKYTIVLWSLITEDYNPELSAEKCLKNAIKRTKKGDIVVFHDSEKASKNVLYVLPKYLDYFSKKGFTFETIES